MSNIKKYQVTVNAAKMDKSRIETREYTNNEGETVKVLDYKMDIVINPDKEKVVWQGEGSSLVKVGFVVDSQTKDEREAKTASNFIGDVFEWRRGDNQPSSQPKVNEIDYPEANINPDDIPF